MAMAMPAKTGLSSQLKKGYKTIDVPIHYYPRSYKEGKKINWRHGFLDNPLQYWN